MATRRLETVQGENDGLNSAAAGRGLRTASQAVTSASDEGRHESAQGATDAQSAMAGPVHGIAHRAVARANRAAAASAAAAAAAAAADNFRSGEKRSLLDLGNGLTIGLDDSYDEELEQILLNNIDVEETAGDGDQDRLGTNSNPTAKASTANDIVDAMTSTATSSLSSPPRTSSASNVDPRTSSPLTSPNNDRNSARDKLLLEQGGGGRGGGESIHHRISGGGALEIFPLPTDPPTSAPTPRPIYGVHSTTGGSTTTTTVPPNGGVQDDLESAFERRCSTITSLGDLSPSLLIGETLQEVSAFQGHSQFDDDITLVAARYNGPPAG